MVADELDGPRPPGDGAAGTLGPEEARLLAYGSAIGSEFDLPLLVRAIGAPEAEVRAAAERLEARGILARRPGDPPRFGFVEEETRARTYRALTESRRRVLHRKIAEALEGDGPERPVGPGGRAAELGRHFFLGKVPEKSLAYNRRAADDARRAEEPERAIHHYERILLDLEHLSGDRRRERAEAAEALADLLFAVGDYRGADRRYAEALESASTTDPSLTARLLLARAEIAREDLGLAAAARGALEARQLFLAAGDRHGVAETHRLLGRLAFARGAYTESLEEHMQSLEMLDGERDPHRMGLLSIDLGNSFALMGDSGRPIAVDWYRHAIDCLLACGDWTELSRAYHNLGVAVGEERPEDGLEYLAKAREAAERAHDPRSVGWALLSGVEMRLALGQVEEAGRDNEQAARTFAHLEDPLGLEQVDQNRGEIAERRGQWDDAEGAYRAAIAQCRAHGLAADEAEAQFRLARLLSKTRDWPRARAAFADAARLGLPRVRPNLRAAFEALQATLDDAERARPAADRTGRPDGRPLE